MKALDMSSNCGLQLSILLVVLASFALGVPLTGLSPTSSQGPICAKVDAVLQSAISHTAAPRDVNGTSLAGPQKPNVRDYIQQGIIRVKWLYAAERPQLSEVYLYPDDTAPKLDPDIDFASADIYFEIKSGLQIKMSSGSNKWGAWRTAHNIF